MVLGAALPGLVFLMLQRTWAQYGPPLQPSMWAVPGAVVSKGSDVTIFCRILAGATIVRLARIAPSTVWYDGTPQGTQEVFEFSLKNIIQSNAGHYYCEYFRGDESSRSSDSLELVVTGIYNEKPFLSADAGPQEISERNVTLLCHTHSSFDTFILCRGGNASFPQSCLRQDHNTFLISPVRPGHRRTYICFASLKHSSYLWSLPSDLLEFSIPVFLMVQKIWAQHGSPPQPSIWVSPGVVVSTGSDVTIFCRTLPGVTTVRLACLAPSTVWYDGTPQGAQEVFELSLKNITQSNAGVYFCAYFNGSQWSRNSNNLELVITGVYNEKSFLSADSGPQEISERNMTLLCHTHPSFDIFILCRGGSASFPQSCSRQDHSTFLISPVSPGNKRTYRCFGSHKQTSYLWSLPSDLLEFSIPQSSTSDCRLENHIRLILAIVILLGLGVLLLDACNSRESP
ncbi:leukocyte immunoglobulin-like receptor subfamily A member 3 isoform X1 [Microtus oregoni]|uniref:leukocyte immunoglobulin-like receptor subfamily A member 3 isoform X1 n=1 Tax=Microtus oregoni TaxID=111838 RepID=UPI001BB23F7F|nr:leukocyte immunoglobulin-like receptor subfamily A member 3 isoform X1 [Microtus oregoni]